MIIALKNLAPADKGYVPEYGQRSILVVDDDASVLTLIETVLVGAGYRVLTTDDGREALRRLEQTAVDLVILDIFMPDHDGIETLGEIRRKHPGLPVLVISGADAGSSYLRAAMAFGATTTMGKPFSFDELIETVGGLVGDRHGEP